MDDAIAMIVDGNDHIVEVVTTKVNLDHFDEDGYLRLQSFEVDIPQWEGQDQWREGHWRLIYELPIGCFEIDLPSMREGDRLEMFVGDPNGTPTLRPCVAKPIVVDQTEVHHADS